MATIHISFDGGDVPVVTGARPADPQTPIDDPTETGYTTNQTVIVDEGDYCFGLETPQRYAPLWQAVSVFDGPSVNIAFRKVA
jgi:hypothetical protein